MHFKAPYISTCHYYSPLHHKFSHTIKCKTKSMQSTGQKKFLAPSQKSTGSFTAQNIVQSLQRLHYPNSLGNRRLGIIMKHVLQQIFQIH